MATTFSIPARNYRDENRLSPWVDFGPGAHSIEITLDVTLSLDTGERVTLTVEESLDGGATATVRARWVLPGPMPSGTLNEPFGFGVDRVPEGAPTRLLRGIFEVVGTCRTSLSGAVRSG